MRYLNKIVFINSAKTPYAEIMLDGNVHLIGTQGVGKSTLLRAILFFYNGDKTRLGIEPGRQPFDGYYFPFDNSYIVYEVARETGPYCVVALKSGGKTAFRFLSGAYNGEHFVSPAGEALVWEAVRKNLDQVGTPSRKIEKYSEYRDILYGNTADLPAELRKYALLQSRQYQNIPRTIQNVFLNSKLDAKFIKQTIIKSLNEEEVQLDLNKYTQHLKDFESHLSDILKWSDKAGGTVAPVRKLANAIAEAANTLHQNSLAGGELRTQIAKAWDAVLEAQPEIEKALSSGGEKIIDAKRRWNEYATRSNAAKQLQLGKVAVFAGKLEDAKKGEAEYAQQNIAEVLLRAQKSSSLFSGQKALVEERNLLSKTFVSVADKYREQVAQAEAQLQHFKDAKEKERLEGENHLLQAQAKIAHDFSVFLAEATEAQAPRRQEAVEAVDAAKETLRNREREKREAQSRRFLESETEELKTQMTAGSGEEKELAATLKITLLEMAQVTERSEQAVFQSDREMEALHQSHLAGIATLDAAIAKIEILLENAESSFYDWLCTEMPGWEATIGKVIDAETVLFNPGLSPAKAPNGTGDFFGVSIDLSAISRTVKTRADYEAEVAGLQKQRAVKGEAIAGLNTLKVENAIAIRRKFAPQLSALKDAEKKARYDSEQLAGKLKRLHLEQQDLERAAAAEKARILAAVEAQLSAAREALITAEAALENGVRKALAETADLQKARDKKLKEAGAIWGNTFVEIKDALRRQEAETEARIKNIKAQESGALQTAGADAKRIAEVETALARIEAQLGQIAAEATLVSEYHKDKRELFDKVSTFLAGKKHAEAEVQGIEEKLLRRQTTYREEMSALEMHLKALQAQQSGFAEDLEAAQNFAALTPDFDKAQFPAVQGNTTTRRLKDLCREATELRYQREQSLRRLQMDTTRFADNFSTKNIFGFPTSFAYEAAYLQFAGELEAFVAEDKIAVFEQRLNAQYADLIRLIGREMNDLNARSGEIQKVIVKINRDFEERAFAGVIRSIKLQISKSTDTLVCLLEEINRFNEEHNLSTGGINLFSTGNLEAQNATAVSLLKAFATAIPKYGESQITLANTFELQFRIVENDNDSGWLEQLSKVGSEGTDVLVKAMINIMLLNVFKEKASGRFSDFKLHCMMDEIGRLHPTNVAGILKFANDRNILLINGSPTSYNAGDYKYTYLLRKDAQSNTSVVQLVKNTALS